MKKQLATIALIGLSLSTIFAQELVKDINPNTADSDPQSFTTVGDKLFFTAESPNINTELWITDGTEAGTVLLKDIDTGGGMSSGVASDVEIIDLNGKAIFPADNGTQGAEIWISDGTEAGTMMIKEIHGSPTAGNGSNPRYLTKMGAEVFFNASDKHSGVFNEELWKTDGTAAGTVLVKEINPSTRSRPEYLTEMNGKIYFSANDGTGPSLWATDGTEAGTVMIKSNGMGNASFTPKNIIKMGNEIFFNAYESGTNYELWKSDGTEAGTVLVKDIASGPAAGSEPDNFIVAGNTLYFKVSGGALWKTDGSAAGTILVTNTLNVFFTMISFKDELYFIGQDATYGREIYKIGTSGIPELLKDIDANGNSGVGTFVFFEVHGSKLYFDATDGSGYKLWQTDGTEAGTMEVPNAPSNLSNPEYMYSFGNKLIFSGYDNSLTGGTGREPWVFDNLSSSEFTEVACPSFDYEGVTHTQTGDYDFTFTNTLGYDSTVTLKLTIDCDTAGTVGISTLQEFEITAFPNPLGDVLNISCEEKLSSISLLNINGAIIKSFDPSLKSFDVSAVSKGVYFLEVNSAGKNAIIKILKK